MGNGSNRFLNLLNKAEKIINQKKNYNFLINTYFNKNDEKPHFDYTVLNDQIRTMKMIDVLIQTESLLKGHFELSSGLHSNQYFQCAKLLQYPEHAEKAGKQIAEMFDKDNTDIVVAPALGGLIIGYEVARALGKKSIFTERKDGIMTLRRGFEINRGDRVVIIEDVITTAKSTMETINVIKALGGEIAGVGCIVDRSQGQTAIKIKSLLQIEPEIYTPDECPMCKAGIPIDKPGSRTAASK